MNESCHTYEWVMSHMNMSHHRVGIRSVCHIWVQQARKWVMSRMNESCHIWMSHVTHSYVTSQGGHTECVCVSHLITAGARVSHVTYERVMSHVNESCHTIWFQQAHNWVMSRMNESCHMWMSHVTHERVTSQGGHMDHSRRTSESCHTWMSHVTHERVMSHINE